MKVLHISAECYPAAKAGGLGDVAGALPKYQTKSGFSAAVIIPKYQTKWILAQSWTLCLEGSFMLGNEAIDFTIEKLVSADPGFELYVANIPGKFDRPGVYLDENGRGYKDEVERSLCFQQAALYWTVQLEELPSIIHCHDHHTGLSPFMIKHCPVFSRLSNIPTVFTIHNAAYHGAFGWERVQLLPLYDGRMGGLLDWDRAINPLASAIKCCWRLTTVSPSYMFELRLQAGNLAPLLQQETPKSSGILNGIDTQVWDPQTDPFLPAHLKRSVKVFKQKNRAALAQKFVLQKDLPLITFIGRLAGEKGADLLAPMIQQFLEQGNQASFIILGTGEPHLHRELQDLAAKFPKLVNVALEYNEGLAHQLYAGSDFLVMPSKVEPCGLNQMYAMRYGTIPIVRAVGGLKDTVIDITYPNGRGIQFTYLKANEAANALERATTLFKDRKRLENIRNYITTIDFSWENSASQYISLYQSLLKLVKSVGLSN